MHLVLNFIAIIILLVLNESDCNNFKPVYRSDGEKFRNIAVTPHFVYIGGNSKIIQLSSSLQLEGEKTIDHENIKYPENWLLTVLENETLIVCNYESEETYNTRCRKYKVESGIGAHTLDTFSIKINHQSTRYLTTTVVNKNVLLIASSTCIHIQTIKDTTCYAILNLEVNSFEKFNLNTYGLGYFVEYVKTKHVTFKTAFKVKGFVYFLLNAEEGLSKLGKICTSNPNTTSNSYEDTPIICSHNNTNYTLAEDAVFWMEYLYVAFIDDSSSVICKYKLVDIKTKFQESRQNRLQCPYTTTQNRYFTKQVVQGDWCFNKSSSQCKGNSAIVSKCSKI